MSYLLLGTVFIVLLILFWALREPPKRDPRSDVPAAERPEKLLRGRKEDREIEEEFPDEAFKKKKGKKGERGSEDEDGGYDEDLEEEEYDLPYSADEIIPETSRTRIYKRTLQNAEIYGQKGDFKTAISLYEGVQNRISDAAMRDKISSNVEYLKNRKTSAEKQDKEVKEELQKQGAMQNISAGDVKFNVEGPVPQTINIQLSEEQLREEVIVEKVTRKIQDELREIKEKYKDIEDNIEDAVKDEIEDDYDNYNEETGELKNDLESLRGEMEKLGREKTQAEELMRAQREILDELTRSREIAAHRDESAVITSGEISTVQNDLTSLKDELDDLKKEKRRTMDELENIREAPAAREKELSRFQDQLQELYEKMKDLESEKKEKEAEVEKLRNEKEETQNEEIERLKKELEETKETHREIIERERELSYDTIDANVGTMDAPSPYIEQPILSVDSAPLVDAFMEVADAIRESQAIAAAASPVTAESAPKGESETLREHPDGPAESHDEELPRTSSEVLTEKETDRVTESEEEEDPNEFDLIKDYGVDKDESTISDEEIFEKILQQDSDQKEEENFEILGDSRTDEDIDIMDKDVELKMKEDQNFYKNLIKTDKMKKKELPILRVSYDFTKLPEEISLSKEKNILEYSFYKYKPMLDRANEYLQKRKVRDAINYYKVVLDQNIPPEFKAMIRKNLQDLNEYLEKYLAAD